MLDFSLVDAASHDGGPDASPALAAAAAADRLVGRFVTGLERLGLGGAVNFVVVSDHGMAETRPDRVVVLDDLIDPATVDVLETGPMLRVARRTPVGPLGTRDPRPPARRASAAVDLTPPPSFLPRSTPAGHRGCRRSSAWPTKAGWS